MGDWDSGYNVVNFGAVGDGATDDTAAIQAALTAATDTAIRRRVDDRGGRVFLPAGKYLCSSTLTLPSRGLILEGAGSGVTGGAHASAQLLFTMTGSQSGLQANSSAGTVIRNLQVFTNNTSYTGRLIDLRNISGLDTAFALVDRCTIAGPAGGAGTGIDLDKCNTSAVRDCNFTNLAVGISGQQASSYSNQNDISGCQFVLNSTVHIKNPGDGWGIDGNTFEQLNSGAAGGIGHDAGVVSRGVEIANNWFGDITASAGGSQITWGGHAVNIHSNYIGFNTGATGVTIDDTGSDGVTMISNEFDASNGVVAINFSGSTPGKAILLNQIFRQSMTISSLPSGSTQLP